MSKQRLGIGSDHGGVDLKAGLIKYLAHHHPEIEINDLGTHSNDSVDYPDYGHKVAQAVRDGDVDQGLLICGSGIGISMAANRHKGIRAALVYDEETAKLAKAHNNANILCLGGRLTPLTVAEKILTVWLQTEFEGGRHVGRIEKLDA